MTDAFFEPLGGERFRALPATAGPWDPRHQHGGPPSALLGRALERCAGRVQGMLARVTVEILGPVPAEGELTATAELLRPGRRVELVEAQLSAEGRPVMTARGWRIATTELELPQPDALAAPADPHRLAAADLPPQWRGGYLAAMEWRFASGAFGEPGPATVWARARCSLVAGEELTPLQRVLLTADSGNGVSNRLDLDSWLFINPELTVHLHRPAAGEWVCLEADTTVESHGVGLAETRLWDRRGRIGRGAQSLLVDRR